MARPIEPGQTPPAVSRSTEHRYPTASPASRTHDPRHTDRAYSRVFLQPARSPYLRQLVGCGISGESAPHHRCPHGSAGCSSSSKRSARSVCRRRSSSYRHAPRTWRQLRTYKFCDLRVRARSEVRPRLRRRPRIIVGHVVNDVQLINHATLGGSNDAESRRSSSGRRWVINTPTTRMICLPMVHSTRRRLLDT